MRFGKRATVVFIDGPLVGTSYRTFFLHDYVTHTDGRLGTHLYRRVNTGADQAEYRWVDPTTDVERPPSKSYDAAVEAVDDDEEHLRDEYYEGVREDLAANDIAIDSETDVDPDEASGDGGW